MKKKGKRPFERGRHRWENNIKMVLQQQYECGRDSNGSGTGPKDMLL
jgi:hypothetical protein